MNRSNISVLLSLFFLLFFIDSYAQSAAIKKRNFICLDTLEQIMRKTLCNGNLQFDKDPKKEYSKFLPVMDLLNHIANDNFSLSWLKTELKKIKVDTIFRNRYDNGGIKVLDLRVPNEGFYVDIRLESIDGLIVRKKYMIEAKEYFSCNTVSDKMLNFPLLKYVVADHANFLIRIPDPDYVQCDTLVYPNIDLAAKESKEYKIIRQMRSEEAWVNRILEKQFDFDSSRFYSFDRPGDYFDRFVRDRKYGIISDLLYSPNYLFSINAMEALIYLDHVGKIKLSDAERKRIDVIKNQRSDICVLGYDIKSNLHGYKELQTTDEKVIAKYTSWFGK